MDLLQSIITVENQWYKAKGKFITQSHKEKLDTELTNLTSHLSGDTKAHFLDYLNTLPDAVPTAESEEVDKLIQLLQKRTQFYVQNIVNLLKEYHTTENDSTIGSDQSMRDTKNEL